MAKHKFRAMKGAFPRGSAVKITDADGNVREERALNPGEVNRIIGRGNRKPKSWDWHAGP